MTGRRFRGVKKNLEDGMASAELKGVGNMGAGLPSEIEGEEIERDGPRNVLSEVNSD